jgi:hypothetical protein
MPNRGVLGRRPAAGARCDHRRHRLTLRAPVARHGWQAPAWPEKHREQRWWVWVAPLHLSGEGRLEVGRRLLQLSFLGALGKENMESAHSKGIESSHFEERWLLLGVSEITGELPWGWRSSHRSECPELRPIKYHCILLTWSFIPQTCTIQGNKGCTKHTSRDSH